MGSNINLQSKNLYHNVTLIKYISTFPRWLRKESQLFISFSCTNSPHRNRYTLLKKVGKTISLKVHEKSIKPKNTEYMVDVRFIR
jgi:hypothetical protein